MSTDWVLQRYDQLPEEIKYFILLLKVKKLQIEIFFLLLFIVKVCQN